MKEVEVSPQALRIVTTPVCLGDAPIALFLLKLPIADALVYKQTPDDERLSMSVKIRFLPDDVTVEAIAGEPMLKVAARAGVTIPTGCLMGSCHACEVEYEDGTPFCACITAVPVGQQELTIHLYSDPLW